MRSFKKIVFLLVLLGFPASAAQPQGFKFTKITDVAGPVASFRSGEINNSGTVAVTVTLDGGRDAVLVGNERTLTVVAEGSAGSFGAAKINNRGDVVFSARLPGRTVIFLSRQGRLSTLVESTGALSVIGDPVINAKGTVAFRAILEPSIHAVQAVLTLDHGAVTTIAQRPVDFFTFPIVYDINERGQVLYLADPNSRFGAAFTVSDGRTKWVAADASGTFEIFSDAVINESGTVAFTVFSFPGGEAEFGVYLSDRRNGITPVVTSDGPFRNFLLGGLSNSGTPVFLGFLDTGETGIFVGPDPVADKVIMVGDTLDGSTVTGLSVSDVNASGQILLVLSFEDAPTALYRVQRGAAR
jgi:hypothetical protein